MLTLFPLLNQQDSQYWRFTNDRKDPGYPKQIVKGFGGLNGKIVAALSIAKHKDRPESVYFFKRGMFTITDKITKLLSTDLPEKFYSVFSFIKEFTVKRSLMAIIKLFSMKKLRTVKYIQSSQHANSSFT